MGKKPGMIKVSNLRAMVGQVKRSNRASMALAGYYLLLCLVSTLLLISKQ